MSDEYGGLFGAYRYAYGASPSLLFRSYVVVSALVGAFVAILLILATVSWIADSAGLIGEKALLWVLGILVLLPLTAPVLLVARRRRLDVSTTNADRALGLAGFLFVLSVYVGLVITDPATHDVWGPFDPVMAVLDSLPDRWGLLLPVFGVLAILATARLTSPD